MAIIAFIITSLINPQNSILPYNVVKDVNWFSQNPELSKNIATGFYAAAVVFGILTIYNIISTLFDQGGSDDEVH